MTNKISKACIKEKFNRLIDSVKRDELSEYKWCNIINMMGGHCFENKEDVIEFAQAKAYRTFYLETLAIDDFVDIYFMILNSSHLTAQLQDQINRKNNLFDCEQEEEEEKQTKVSEFSKSFNDFFKTNNQSPEYGSFSLNILSFLFDDGISY
jgi:uncharacterized Fe-S cluster-containing radical SAM superfamily protein